MGLHSVQAIRHLLFDGSREEMTEALIKARSHRYPAALRQRCDRRRNAPQLLRVHRTAVRAVPVDQRLDRGAALVGQRFRGPHAGAPIAVDHDADHHPLDIRRIEGRIPVTLERVPEADSHLLLQIVGYFWIRKIMDIKI